MSNKLELSSIPKKCLPHGWIVKTSSTYPDRVYYFNTRTNTSSWEQPALVSQEAYIASIPKDVEPEKRSTQVNPSQDSRSISSNHNTSQSSCNPNRYQHSARTPVKRGVKLGQNIFSSYNEEAEFSPTLNTDSEGPSQSDNDNDVENKPSLTDFQKQILENEEIKTQLESEVENFQQKEDFHIPFASSNVNRYDGQSERDVSNDCDRELSTFSVSDSLKRLRQTASAANTEQSSPLLPSRLSKTHTKLKRKIESDSDENEPSTNALVKLCQNYSQTCIPIGSKKKLKRKIESDSDENEPSTNALVKLRQNYSQTCIPIGSKKKLNEKTQNPTQRPRVSFSLTNTLKNLRKNENRSVLVNTSVETKKEVSKNKSQIQTTCEISDSTCFLPKQFGKPKKKYSKPSQIKTEFKPDSQCGKSKSANVIPIKKSVIFSVSGLSTTTKIPRKKRRIQHCNADSVDSLQISLKDDNKRKIVCKDTRQISISDLRVKLNKKKKDVTSVDKETDVETVQLPAPKKRQIQTWINSIAEAEPLYDFPPSPVSKTSSRSDDSTLASVSSKDRRVVLSTDTSHPVDSGYSSCSVLTLNMTSPVTVANRPETPVTIGGDEEEMEIDEEEEMMIVDLQEVREEVGAFPHLVVGKLTKHEIKQKNNPIKDFQNQGLYIIIDTNILVQSLKFLQNLTETIIQGFGLPYMVIPWVVMQELDYIKDGKSKHSVSHFTKTKAFQAVKHLFSCLQNKHPRVVGQTSTESRQVVKDLQIECNDDRVLQCCLMNIFKYPNACIVLLTDDLNLCNKACVNNINAFTKQDLFSGLDNLVKRESNTQNSSNRQRENDEDGLLTTELSRPRFNRQSRPVPQHEDLQTSQSPLLNEETSDVTPQMLNNDERKQVDELLCEVKEEIKRSLGVVLETEMRKPYGNIWKCVVFRKPPWSALDIMESIQKHWMAVFGLILNRKKQSLVTEIVNKLKSKSSINMKIEDIQKIIENIIKFLVECGTRQDYGGVLKVSKNKLQNLLTKYQPKFQSTSSTPQHPSIQEEIIDKDEVLLKSVQDRFQIIWSTINDCSDNLPHLDNPTSILALIIPVITEIRQQYAMCLSINPKDMCNHRVEIETFTHLLNTFFSKFNAESPRPITSQASLLFFTNPLKRETLILGLDQLDQMIQKFHSYVQML